MTRISIVKGDPGYDPTHTRRVKRVLLNGQVVTAVTADEEHGFVDLLVSDGNRGIKLDHQGNPVTERKTGRVVIELLGPDERSWDQNRRQSSVRVQVGREPGTGALLVQVFSVVRPGALTQGKLDRLKLPAGGTDLCQTAGVLAGAIAERLCEQFGDTLDPSAAAAEAVRQCAKMLEDEARLK